MENNENQIIINRIKDYIIELRRERNKAKQDGFLSQTIDAYFFHIEEAARIVIFQVTEKVEMTWGIEKLIQNMMYMREKAKFSGLAFMNVEFYFDQLENAAKEALKKMEGQNEGKK